MNEVLNIATEDAHDEPPSPSYTDQLVNLVAAVADGREFTVSALRLIHFVKCNAAWLETELLG